VPEWAKKTHKCEEKEAEQNLEMMGRGKD
jgi:hypothetical protein